MLRLFVKATPPPDGSNLHEITRLLTSDLLQDNKRTVKLALSTLADMCICKPPTVADENRKRLHKAGGHLLIVQVLKKWYTNKDIQRQGARALQNAGSAGVETANFGRDAVGVGALEICLQAMYNFPRDQDVQRCACGAILNLVLKNEANTKKLVVDLMGTQEIVLAMRRFPYCRDLQEWGAWTMDNASSFESLQGALVKDGSIRVLAAAMENFESDYRIQVFARRSMMRLCHKKPILGQARGEGSVVSDAPSVGNSEQVTMDEATVKSDNTTSTRRSE
jgi:hypothetical protein